jgi:HlyD family secretion protein
MTNQNTRSTDARESLGITTEPTEVRGRLPAVIEHPPPRRKRPSLRLAVLALLIMVAGAGIGWFWWYQHNLRLPLGIAWGNGRLEADPIAIDTKFAGRIAKLFVDEGGMVKAGQVVAMMDTRDLEASLKKSEALVTQAERAFDEAKANLVQQQTQVKLAQQELDRTSALVPKGFATVELLDQRRRLR